MKLGRSTSTNLAAVALWIGLSATAVTGELCVTCQGPDAVYRCTFGGASDSSAPQLACIGELARQGGHKSCSIARNRQGPCEGAIREVAVVGGDEAPATAPKDSAAGQPPVEAPAAAVETYEPAPESRPPSDHADDAVPARPSPANAKPETKAADAEKPAKPPRTVKEIVEKSAEGAGDAVSGAAKSAGDAAEKTGSAIGNAAKKTWKCLTSLFGDC